jgi:hypothetical protein
MRNLIERFDLNLDPGDALLDDPGFWQRTIPGQRRPLADLLRLQLYGISWAATGIDQAVPREVELRRSDFEVDYSWGSYEGPAALSRDDLALDVLSAGQKLAGDVPLLIVNEPIFISDGQNSDIRYNAWYPRWAYDRYRELLEQAAADGQWAYIDLWDAIEPANFTDSPVHLTADGVSKVVSALKPALAEQYKLIDLDDS